MGTGAEFAKTTLIAEIDEQIDAWEDRILLLEASRMVPARGDLILDAVRADFD